MINSCSVLCSDFVGNINPMEIARVMGCCCVCCLGEEQHTLQSVCSQNHLQNPLSEQRLCSHTNISTTSTEPVSTAATNLAERQNPHLKNLFLSKPHELFLCKARKGF